ncbi:DUF2079 domain-containing protein [Streptomyces sp. CB02009]|uniref:DUF2079 domain-containing protein n=1 Tax=Streptomyces sp. CB02009 TaxID=1703938 RepID=UPI0009A10A15|nr:DUF2079 domain-containing protein [Streptomyces sp. CB02009]
MKDLHSELSAAQKFSALLARARSGAGAGASRANLLALGLAGFCFVLYTVLSVSRHRLMLTTGYDLGIFEQAVRSYAHGRLPVSELKGHDYPLLGDHFSPVTATIAPFYRLWPSPYTLLVTQAFLLALAVVPLTRWACRVVGTAGAAVVGLGFGLSWGIAQTVGFDFHEVCFAVPLLAFAVEALGNERWRAAVAWSLPLLLVKEDLGLTVAAVGTYIALRGRARLGIVTAVAGLAGTALTMLVVVPAFNPDGVFAYFDKVPDGSASGAPGLLAHYTLGLVTPAVKQLTMLMLLAPTAFLALRSPLVLIAVPTLAWRFASANEAYWGTKFHYSAVLMPVAFGAFVHALMKVRGQKRAARWPDTVCTGLVASALFTVLALPLHPFAQLAGTATWTPGARVAVAERVLELIPDGKTVSASNRFVPQLTHRCTVMVLGLPQNQDAPEWVVADTAEPQGWPIGRDQEVAEVARFREKGYEVVAEEAGVVLLRRP